jgi:MoaA/NifB/PqqE/SkfB family radical SAM enzyme
MVPDAKQLRLHAEDCGKQACSVAVAMDERAHLKEQKKSRHRDEIAERFPNLTPVLRIDSFSGLALDGSSIAGWQAADPLPKMLRDYSATAATRSLIENNLAWAEGDAEKPTFAFAYFMLPTACNQRCFGCFMGQDKRQLPPHLMGPFPSPNEISKVCGFLKDHGAKAVVYGGGGELFTWKGAFDFVEAIAHHGLRTVIFTNGTLLSREDVDRLNMLEATLIISLRDTVETLHNAAVGHNGFVDSLQAIEHAVEAGFHTADRLAVEIPVTRANEQRVLTDFLPAMRVMGIVPLIEEYILLSASSEEQSRCHTFRESRSFFRRLRQKDESLGVSWQLRFGQRIIAQPQCQRPLYSFAVFPNGDVMDCPSHSLCYGNIKQQRLRDIIYSTEFRNSLRSFSLCACSVFYSDFDADIPEGLPDRLGCTI